MEKVWRGIETAALLSGLVFCWVALGVGTSCLVQVWTRLKVESGTITVSEQNQEGICLVADEWILPLFWIGILFAIPSLRIVTIFPFSQRRTGKHSRHEGYVRPSLWRRFGRHEPVDINTSSRKSLRLSALLGTFCDAMWELVAAVVLIQTTVNDLAPLAVLVSLSSISSSLCSPVFIQRLSLLNRLSAVRSLLFLERLSMFSAVFFLGKLMCLLTPGLDPSVFPASPFLHGSVTVAPTASVSLAVDDASGSYFDNLQYVFPSWALQVVGIGHVHVDPRLDAMLKRPVPSLWGDEEARLFVWAVFLFSTIGSIARSSRLGLIRRQWISIVATSPFNLHTEPERALPQDVSLVGTLTPSDDDESLEEELKKDKDALASNLVGALEGDYEEEAKGGSMGKPEMDAFGGGDFDDVNFEFRNSPRSSAQAHASVRELKSSLSRMHLVGLFLGSFSLGVILDIGPTQQASLMGTTFVLMCLALSFLFEFVSFGIAYHTDLALQNVRPVIDSSVNFFDPYGSRSIYHPIGVGHARPVFERFKRSLRRWGTFLKSPVFLACLSYTLLYGSVIDCGLVPLSYLRWRRLPAWVLSVLLTGRSLSCGLVGLVRYLHRWTGSLARTASMTLWFLWALVFPVAVAFALSDGPSNLGLGVLILATLLCGPVLRAYSLVHSKLVREWVEDQHLRAVQDSQAVVKLFFVLLIQFYAILHGDPSQYAGLVLLSTTFCFISLVLFALWYRVYDSGTPFQVVDDIGQLVLVVRG